MIPNPLVSVLILNTRNGRQAVRCIENFQKQTIAENIEIIVIDNHSCDESIGFVRNRVSHISNVRIVENRDNLGFGGGYNAGARLARGEYLLINNPDKMMEESGLETLVNEMKKNPAIGLLGPRMLHADGSQRLSVRSFPSPLDVIGKRSFLRIFLPGRLKKYLCLHLDMGKKQKVDWVVGGSFMIRRDFFLDLGLFDERFFLFFEDTDLCRRVRQAGKSVVYLPKVTVRDKKNRFSGESFFDLFFSRAGRIHLLSAVRYFGKWGWR